MTSIFIIFFLNIEGTQKKKNLSTETLFMLCIVFRVLFGYKFNEDNILNLEFLRITSISQENSFFHFSTLLTSRENTATYKTLFPPTACFIMLVLFISAQLPNLIHLLGLFLP